MKKIHTASIVLCSFAALVLAAILIFGLLGNPFTGRDEENRKEFENVYECEAESLDALNIDWASGDIEVKVVEDRKAVRVTEYIPSGFNEDKKMLVSEEGGNLHIRWSKKTPALQIFNFDLNLGKRLVVEIPKTLVKELDEINCDSILSDLRMADIETNFIKVNTTSGNIKLDNLTAKELQIDTTSGRVELNQAEIGKIKMNATSGKMTCEAVRAETLEVDSISGNIEFAGSITEQAQVSGTSMKVHLDLQEIIKTINVDTISGDITLKLPKNSELSIDFDSISGDLESEFGEITLHGDAEKVKNENPTTEIEISSTSGDVRIKKQ